MREGLTALALLLAGCVYPGEDPTGLELSWRFVEGNPSDGDDARQVRTCHGADVATLRIGIEDLDDDSRADVFDFDCELGYQTVIDFQTSASDAFVRLRPGDYHVALEVVDAEGVAEAITEEDLTVAGRQITIQPYVITRATFNWTIELASVDACGSVALRLHHDDPETDLSMFEGDADTPELYRETLVTDRGLSLAGEAAACDETIEGTHVVPEMDRGTYRLEVTIDDRECIVPLELDPTRAQTTLDLQTLPCNG